MEMQEHLPEITAEPFDRYKAALSWWKSLQPEPTQKGDRAALSRLRRATPLDAMAQEATLLLYRRLDYHNPVRLHRVATLACILAHVREHTGAIKFANAIGRTSLADADSALLKPLRFDRLKSAQSEDEIARNFRRAVAMLNGKANVYDLARLILNFDKDEVKRSLISNYYGAGIAAPNSRSSSV